jgi:hypothetical protein
VGNSFRVVVVMSGHIRSRVTVRSFQRSSVAALGSAYAPLFALGENFLLAGFAPPAVGSQ